MNRALDPWPPPQEKGRETKSRRPEKNRFSEKRQGQDSASRHPAQVARPFAVAIVFFGLLKAWVQYTTAAAADAEVAKLKKLKFRAEWVER